MTPSRHSPTSNGGSTDLRRHRDNRGLLILVALVMPGCAVIGAVLALPDEQPGTLPPVPGHLI